MHFFRVDVFIPSLIARLIVVGNVLVVVLDLLDSVRNKREKSAVHPVIPVLGLRPADKYDNVIFRFNCSNPTNQTNSDSSSFLRSLHLLQTERWPQRHIRIFHSATWTVLILLCLQSRTKFSFLRIVCYKWHHHHHHLARISPVSVDEESFD